MQATNFTIGMGIQFTPAGTAVQIALNGSYAYQVAGGGARLKYGDTSVIPAPANGDAEVGTTVLTLPLATAGLANCGAALNLPGLTAGTTYWLDVACWLTGSYQATLHNVTVSINDVQ